MTELPIWWQCETDEQEATRLAGHYLSGGGAYRLLAAMTLEKMKEELDLVPRWRLIRRFRLVREAKATAKDAGLI